MGFNPEVAFVDVCHRLLDMVGRETCQKAQSACVDANDGNLLVCYAACYIKEGAITSHAHYKVSGKLIVLDDFTIRYMNLHVVAQKEIERLGHGKFCFSFGGNGKEFLYSSTLTLLMYIAKKGKLELFSHI